MLAPDDKTLEFHLTQPCGYFLKLLSLPVYYPSKEGVATNDNATWATTPETSLCNGPFMLTDYVEGQYYTVEKNPYFYNADEVTLSTLIAGQDYYVCVDSFNENGITTGKIIKMEG